MKNMKWIVLGTLALSSCQQNPFLGMEGEISGKKLEQKEVYPEYVISAEPIYFCEEAKPCMIQIRPQVPAPGVPVLRIDAFPPGAKESDFVWDARKNMFVLTWTPGFDVVEPSKGTGITKNVPLPLRLWSSEHAETIVTDTVQITVKNTQQEWSVRTNGPKSVDEGGLLRQEVYVESIDYPNGPFQLFAKDAPTGTVIEQDAVNPKKFIVTFRPEFTFVQATSNPPPQKRVNRMYKEHALTYLAKDPGEGLERTEETTWTVFDVRKSPVLTAPSSMIFREQGAFAVRADDMNFEISPNFKTASVPFGRLETVVSKIGTATFLNLKWLDIPASKQGTSTSITFEACAKEGEWVGACVAHVMNVQFLFNVPPAPAITRTAWPLNDVKYVKVGTALRVNIPIEDPEEKSRAVGIEIFPESLRTEVQWVNGQLVINPRTEGLLQINLEATTIPGQKKSESFFLHVLPRTWSDIVVFSNDLEKPETQAILTLLPKATMVHPIIQKEDPRAFVMRKVFIITSELLASMTTRSDWAWLDEKMKSVQNLWIATPHIDKLQKNSPYFAQLMIDKDVKLPGRLNFFYPQTPLSDFYLEMGRYQGIEAPKKLVKWSGQTTAESFNPSLVEVIPGTQKCTNLFTMRSARALGDLAAVCDYSQSGKLVLFGTEFVDFKFEAEDAGLLSKWVTKLLRDGGVQ